MIPPRTEALVFDFDGVLVESTAVKTEAFAATYLRHGEDIAREAVAYHLKHEGISRLIKFRHLHQKLLGVSLTDEHLAQIGREFSQRVFEQVVAAPWVPGAREFLETYSSTLPLFVASGTPDEELKTIVMRRGMQRYFRSVHGTPSSKGEIISAIIGSHAFDPGRVLVVGDGTADFAGAREAGARFVGRAQAASNPFPPGTLVIPDLQRLSELL